MKGTDDRADGFRIETLGPAELPNPMWLPTPGGFVDDEERILVEPYLAKVTSALEAGEIPASFEVAGPRQHIFFEPAATRVAVVTCGGLSPGINDTLRALVLQLWHRYGVRSILGIRFGYAGLSADSVDPPLALDPDVVRYIQEQGGTILGTSRGSPPTSELVDSLERLDVQVLFVIGGDGTMRGARALCLEAERRGRRLSVIGLPKTIDNDIPYVRRSFGFETAVTLATTAVRSAHTEVVSVRNGIGLVKLMGRYSGYIAANATLASGDVDFCLVPEIPFRLEGEQGLYHLLERKLEQRGSALVVVAEGAGQEYVGLEGERRDRSGNLVLGDVGVFLRDRLAEHFSREKIEVTMKYIDPSYLIRSAPANPSDALFCARLAQNAAHAAMAGKTAMLVGFWHGQMAHVPLAALAGKTKTIHPAGELWRNVLESTGQPSVIG